MTEPFDVLVVGAGIAGLAAATGAARRGLVTGCAEEMMFGGLVLNVTELDPAPCERPRSGVELATSLMDEASAAGVATILEAIVATTVRDRLVRVQTASQEFRARAVILASGARFKPLEIPGEKAFEHRGVAHCADCDGPFYAGQDVVVVGGGDSGLQEALVLARHCRSVFLVHRRGEFRARSHFVEAIGRQANIRPVFDTVLREIRGREQVESVVAQHVPTGATREIPCAGVFPYVGLVANAPFAPPEIGRDRNGFILTDARRSTTIPQIYAVGALRSEFGGLLDDAFTDAEIAVASIGGRESPG